MTGQPPINQTGSVIKLNHPETFRRQMSHQMFLHSPRQSFSRFHEFRLGHHCTQTFHVKLLKETFLYWHYCLFLWSQVYHIFILKYSLFLIFYTYLIWWSGCQRVCRPWTFIRFRRKCLTWQPMATIASAQRIAVPHLYWNMHTMPPEYQIGKRPDTQQSALSIAAPPYSLL